MTKWAKYFEAMSDDDARDHFAKLCEKRFGQHWRNAFCEHVGIQNQTMSRWMNHERPRLWAMVFMQEWKDGERNRLIVDGLARFKSLLEAT